MAKKIVKDISPKHKRFTYTQPKIIRSRKQWWIYYSIKYAGEHREYRKDYGGKDFQFNRIKDLTTRQISMEAYIEELKDQLNDGIDFKRVEEAREIILRQAENKKKYEVQAIFDNWWSHAGYANPSPNQRNTAVNFEHLFRKRFLPYLSQNGLMKDIRDIKKIHVKEFLNEYQFKLKLWSASTTRVKNQWLGSFFKFAVDNELIESNPTHGISITGSLSAKKARFQVFKKEEIQLIFEELEKYGNLKLELLIKGLYYAYIRISEWLRLDYSNVDLARGYIFVKPEQSKTGRDGVTRNVIVHPELRKVLDRYFKSRTLWSHDDKLFFKMKNRDTKTPVTSTTMRITWLTFFKNIKAKYPSNFQREGLSLYSFKHSGVTFFYQDNISKKTSQSLLEFIKRQCRHKSIVTTERYLRDDLGIDIDDSSSFFAELGIQ